jgi:hypothetical protein
MSYTISFGNPATATAGLGLGDTAEESQRYQTFTLHEPTTLTAIRAELRAVPTHEPWTRPPVPAKPRSNVLVSIRNVVNGAPGPVEYAAGAFAASALFPTWSPPYAWLAAWGAPTLAAGQYAVVLWLEHPDDAGDVRYEWAVGPARAGEHFGRGATSGLLGPFPTRPRWVDETGLGSACLELVGPGIGWSNSEMIDVTAAAKAGSAFGSGAGEVRRFQTFYTTYDSETIHGVDVRVRRVGLGRQSDVLVHLHATANGLPTGEPLATAVIRAGSIGTDWTVAHADLRCAGLTRYTAYAIVLTQRLTGALHYEWARAEVDNALGFGKWTGSAWVDESGLGDGWMKLWGLEPRLLVRGEHAATTGIGFGNEVDEVQRYQVVDASQVVGHAVWGVDLKVRKAFGSGQSDIVVSLYRAAAETPAGAPLATATVPAWCVGTEWTIVHAPLWLESLPAGRVAVVVGQAVPRPARYEWAVGDASACYPPPGAFGKWTPTGLVDESHFGTGWFKLWSDYCYGVVHDVSCGGPRAWYGFGNTADEVKRFEIVTLESVTATNDVDVVGVELELRKAFGTGQSDVVVQLFEAEYGRPTGLPLAEAVIPESAVSADAAGSVHRVVLPHQGYGGADHPYAVVVGQRRPRSARYEWATAANPLGVAFGKWTGGAWVDESSLGAGSTRVWLRRWP